MLTMTARAREWEVTVRAWEASGMSASAWCREHGVVLKTFAWWRWRLRDERAPDFVEVHVDHVVEPTPIEVALRGGYVVRVRAGFDAAMLRSVVVALESA